MSPTFLTFVLATTVRQSWSLAQRTTRLKSVLPLPSFILLLIIKQPSCLQVIDVWSTGCVMAELMLGQPLFPGESGIDQLVEIIKVLGTPSREQIRTMNPNYMEHKFPQIKPHPFNRVMKLRVLRINNVSQLLTLWLGFPKGPPWGHWPNFCSSRVYTNTASIGNRGTVSPFLWRAQRSSYPVTWFAPSKWSSEEAPWPLRFFTSWYVKWSL